MQANIVAAQAQTRGALETIGAFQAEVRTAQIRAPRNFACAKVFCLVRFEVLNPSHSGEMTVAPYHSTIESEVVIGPSVLRRSERLLKKPKVDYRQVALQPRWPVSTAVSSDPGQILTLIPSSSSVALQQHANPSTYIQWTQH